MERATSIRPSSARKRDAILDAAQAVFLRDGFANANMDDLTDRAGVSKQTVYAHFGNKEALFVAVVERMTAEASDRVHLEVPDPESAEQLPDYLRGYGRKQLDIVLAPDLLALRRLVIGESSRFRDLAHAFWQSGPRRAMSEIARRFARLAERGWLDTPDPAAAARTFNWLVMGAPLNAAMMLGDAAIPDAAERSALVDEAVRVFLAAHGAGRGA